MTIYNIENLPVPFLPKTLPFNYNSIYSDPQIIKLVTKANIAIGTYEGFLSSIINPMLLISPLLSQEAVLSSKLEGTHATLEDLLNYEAGNKVDIERDELHEIINYRNALIYALDNISTINDFSTKALPLSNRIIKEMHKILLNNVRGSSKNPGNFKRGQNYIGSKGSISFTPVPANQTPDFMSNLEDYIHYDDVDLLIQSAIIHAQFEMIHPFEDGNGRIGRLLIPLFFYYKELLSYPTFYMSSYFEKDRSLYISHLSNISKNNNWNDWFIYYLEGIIYSSEESTKKAQAILHLYNSMKDEVIPKLNSVSGIQLLDFIFSNPIFKAKQVSQKINISDRSVYTLLNKLTKEGYIKTDSAQRNRTYFCPQLLSIVQ
ncbi:Fic family protein [Streptococcus parauberis]|uniref:Fic family protein n=1 Tax=Streptococcus parauberis TaxID=1348 RepID=UPI000C1C8D2E|nr:Fic/DOC family N-terminal domain-containing protein [Streptococcus parauberis]PIO77944.1 Adenosine monophosphate-protein transferase SoFic [Streptococcus parauberis]POS66617.1 Adenosine monophosphate-protein transferase SoFic [Streptococcus parauberis]HEM3688568.1 Fic family protein [Streptococcus suis]